MRVTAHELSFDYGTTVGYPTVKAADGKFTINGHADGCCADMPDQQCRRTRRNGPP